MLRFLDQSHKFQVAPARVQLLEFGTRRFFTSLTTGMSIAAIEQTLAAGTPLFNNPLLLPAVSFHAECIVFTEKATSPPFPEIQLRQDFDFGFVQGLKSSDFHADFWGRHPKHGRTTTHISMPNSFEVDTAPSAAPFTNVPPERFAIRNVTEANSRFNFLRVSSDMTDHPLVAFDHTLPHSRFGVDNLLRFISFQREFRTIFCARDRKSGDFTPISAIGWTIRYRHTVSYTSNGTVRSVSDDSGGPVFVNAGSPSEVNNVDRQILTMAKNGAPFLTPAVLAARFNPSFSGRTVTVEDENADFVADFFK